MYNENDLREVLHKRHEWRQLLSPVRSTSLASEQSLQASSFAVQAFSFSRNDPIDRARADESTQVKNGRSSASCPMDCYLALSSELPSVRFTQNVEYIIVRSQSKVPESF